MRAHTPMLGLALAATLLLSASATVCDHECLFGFHCSAGLTCSDGICTGTACADGAQIPEVALPDGEALDFDGEAGKIYNFITEQEHQLNAKYAEGAKEGKALVESMGFKLNDTQIQIDADEEGEMTVTIDGKPVELTEENGFRAGHYTDAVNVTVHKYREHLGNTAHMITNLYNMLVMGTPPHWDEDRQETVRGHLNMVLAVDPKQYGASEVDGALGGISPQNAYSSDVQGPPKEEYQVSDLFADNFKHNLFGLAGGAKTIPVDAQARRSLLTHARSHLGEGQLSNTVWVTLPML